ncbi:MAG: hypothetical protein B7Y25_06380 [Alphaproteobacteria bacterium 16-39-46]|nr:MAG: hypothetical protein B7Y25_06380 [Alphaproteobacteria bacterium 16-39-46]OZA42302.1 MAG: hypothetical protein B7X84_06450 [Alphaproteobacteria bacterium 17-39-52]
MQGTIWPSCAFLGRHGIPIFLFIFFNDILNLKDDPIQTVTFLKVNQDPAVAAERQSIVDVMCEDEKHNKFIIEM